MRRLVLLALCLVGCEKCPVQAGTINACAASCGEKGMRAVTELRCECNPPKAAEVPK